MSALLYRCALRRHSVNTNPATHCFVIYLAKQSVHGLGRKIRFWTHLCLHQRATTRSCAAVVTKKSM